MNNLNLTNFDTEEDVIIESFENEEWVSEITEKRREDLKNYANNTIKKEQPVTIYLSNLDLEILQIKALEEGIPETIFLSSILHKYATGKITEK